MNPTRNSLSNPEPNKQDVLQRKGADSSKGSAYTKKVQQQVGEVVSRHSSNIEGSTARSTFGPSDDESGLNFEYSADIRPLTFKLNKSAVHTRTDSEANIHFRESLSQVKQKLSKNNGIYNKGEAALRSLFGSIDREQFENYLKEPHYIKMLKRGKNLKQFRRMFLAQELTINGNEMNENKNKAISLNPEVAGNAIWITKFSLDGNFMASGGKDGVLRIWKVIASPLERWHLDFSEENRQEMKAKTSIIKPQSLSTSPNSRPTGPNKKEITKSANDLKTKVSNLYAPVFHPTPSMILRQHTSDILDIDWSKNNFIATASMDKTACVWHPERSSPLATFIHPDFVTCVAFHPNDDRFLITGCLDHKCRLWSILDHEVTFEFDCQDLVTAITIYPEDPTYTFVGTFNGYIYTLATKGLDYVKSFHVTDKETQRNDYKAEASIAGSKIHHGPRVTCLQCYTNVSDKSLRLVVTTNDSRIRVFSVKTSKCLEILRGFESGSSQSISRLTVWQNKPIVICGSEDHWVYAWRIRTQTVPVESENDESHIKKTTLKDLFTHNKGNSNTSKQSSHHHHSNPLHLKNLFLHNSSGKGDQVIKNSYSVSFHAHHAPVTSVNVAPPVTTKLLSLSNDLICELSLQFYMASDYLDIIRGEESDSDSDSSSSSTNSRYSKSFSHPSLNDFFTSEEQSAHAQALPNVVDAIGTILVTTDSMGVIRVFRADLPANIRKRVLHKLQEYRQAKRNQKSNPVTELSNAPQPNSPMTANNSINYRNSVTIVDDNSSGPSGCPSKRIRASSVFKNSLFNHSNTSLNSCRTNKGSISSLANEEGTLHKPSLGSNVNGNTSMSRLRCDVCNGTKFANSVSQNTRDTGTYCLDCGTMLNNFR